MRGPGTPAWPLWGMCAALTGFLALQAVAFLDAGVFEYPLDDVYIHLAMAEKIARGTYGVNLGEAASASSSILYPFLLLPFPATEAQRLLPLFWNVLAVAGAGWVWGRIAEAAGLAGTTGAAVVLAGPVLLNISGLGFTGMEAAPHLLASLLIVLGLWRALNGQGIAWWLVAAAIAAPLPRYEGLALALAAALALWLKGEWRAASAIGLGALGSVIGFSLYLRHLGLDPIPGSILAKTGGLASGGGLPMRLLLGVLVNVSRPAGAILAALVVTAALAVAAFPGLRRGTAGAMLVTVGAAALAHLFFGQVGWMHRYEPYIIASLLAALLLAGAAAGPGVARLARGTALATMAATGFAYSPTLWGDYVWNPRAITLQQAQMARFAQDYLKVPVAVNDLGRVAWGNPDYVLDIWGLGNAEARKIRFDGKLPANGWAGPLATNHGVKAAMIYDIWFETAVGPDWVRVGELRMDPTKGVLGAWSVSFYATDPGFASEMRAKLERFAPTLPDDAILTILEVGT